MVEFRLSQFNSANTCCSESSCGSDADWIADVKIEHMELSVPICLKHKRQWIGY